MPVQKQARMVLVYQPAERLKSRMRTVFHVAEPSRRSVGDNDIHSARPFQGEAELCYPPLHLFFGILMRALVIPETSPETQDPHAVIYDKMAVNILAAFGRL